MSQMTTSKRLNGLCIMEKSHTTTCPKDQRNKGKQKTDLRASFLLLCIFTDTHIFGQINNAIKIGHTTYQISSGEDFFRNKTPKHLITD